MVACKHTSSNLLLSWFIWRRKQSPKSQNVLCGGLDCPQRASLEMWRHKMAANWEQVAWMKGRSGEVEVKKKTRSHSQSRVAIVTDSEYTPPWWPLGVNRQGPFAHYAVWSRLLLDCVGRFWSLFVLKLSERSQSYVAPHTSLRTYFSKRTHGVVWFFSFLFFFLGIKFTATSIKVLPKPWINGLASILFLFLAS